MATQARPAGRANGYASGAERPRSSGDRRSNEPRECRRCIAAIAELDEGRRLRRGVRQPVRRERLEDAMRRHAYTAAFVAASGLLFIGRADATVSSGREGDVGHVGTIRHHRRRTRGRFHRRSHRHADHRRSCGRSAHRETETKEDQSQRTHRFQSLYQDASPNRRRQTLQDSHDKPCHGDKVKHSFVGVPHRTLPSPQGHHRQMASTHQTATRPPGNRRRNRARKKQRNRGDNRDAAPRGHSRRASP